MGNQEPGQDQLEEFLRLMKGRSFPSVAYPRRYIEDLNEKRREQVEQEKRQQALVSERRVEILEPARAHPEPSP